MKKMPSLISGSNSIKSQHQPELIDASVFMADDAQIIGDVTIRPQSSVWFNAVLRGDTDRITIGDRTNVQDGAIIHVDAGYPCSTVRTACFTACVGSSVTIGHAAVVHGAVIDDDVLIGIGAKVLSGAKIGRECILGTGTLVTGATNMPRRSLVLGLPGRVVRTLTDEELASIKATAERYVGV
jgi:carbonic anhydrase/acetyltransferase-like protein (isoleucine patch superfamily)